MRGHAWQRLQGHVAEGAARCGERHTPDPLEPLPDEALPKAVVLAVDRTQALPRPAHQAPDQVARRDEDLLVRERDALTVLERGDGRTERRDARRRNEHEIGVGIGG